MIAESEAGHNRNGAEDVHPQAGDASARLLDVPLTTLLEQPPSANSGLERFSRAEKQAVNRRMAMLLGLLNQRAAARLRECNPGVYRCGLAKLCAFCGTARATRLKKNYRSRLSRVKTARHLTLTIRSTGELSRNDLRNLRVMLNRLKNSRPFERLVAGGIANYQVLHTSAGWSIHIHCVLDCRAELTENWVRSEWMKLGGGYEVHLDLITAGTVDNVFVYGTQRQPLPDRPDLFAQLYWATYGFQPVQVWGSLHALHGRAFGRTGGRQP